jgi:hypothetical protein
MNLYGTTCAGCQSVMVRGDGDAEICASCIAREEAAPR